MRWTRNRWLLTGGLTLLAVGASAGWWIGGARAAAIPAVNALHYSGTISEKGVPVDGPRDIDVLIWQDGQSTLPADQLCVTTGGSTPVAAGRFELLLADTCTAALATHPEAWAEVKVAGVSFGRQKIGAVPYAVSASSVEGLVKPSVILPSYTPYGTYQLGAGQASLYNDGTNLKRLVVTGNDSSGGTRKIGLYDDVSVAGTLAVVGTVTAPDITITGRANLGVYVKTSTAGNINQLDCNVGDTAISGGGFCNQADSFMAETRPVGSPPTGWYVRCINHDFAFFSTPNNMQVVCMSHGK